MDRIVTSAWPVDLVQTLGSLGRGRTDPTFRVDRSGVWRASRFASGPATVRLAPLGAHRIAVSAWGQGAEEALEAAPVLVGAHDDDGGLSTCADPRVRTLARRRPGLRIGRTGNPMEALVPTILEQKVQGPSARRAFAAMVRAHGVPAPRPPSGGPPLLLPPAADWLAAVPSWMWHRWGVERRRAATIRYAARRAGSVQRAAAAQLQSLPGVGVWTAQEVAMAAYGDPDAVSVGDYWLAHHVCHHFTGEARGSDARMLELLEPWAGQRGRVCRLIMSAGAPLPRFGPRLPLHDIRAI